jgi:hypothetical protein
MAFENDRKSLHGRIDPENPLRIGICSLYDLEERLKAFRLMNRKGLKKRYVLSREEVRSPEGELLLQKGQDIEIADIKRIKEKVHGSRNIKIYQPDEGIALVSDATQNEGIRMTNTILFQLQSVIGNYSGYLDRIDSMYELLNFFRGSFFPKIILIGYMRSGMIEAEYTNLLRIHKMDGYLKFLEILHLRHKPFPYFPEIKNVTILEDTEEGGENFRLELIREYTKPYFVDEA